MSDAFRLDGKVIVLTGAAGIIGTEATRLFLASGARVFAVDRDAALLEQRLGKSHDSLLTCVADVSRKDSVGQAFAQLQSLPIFSSLSKHSRWTNGTR